VLVALSFLLCPLAASAQEGSDLQRFHPATGAGRDLVNVYSARILPHTGISAGLYASYGSQPLLGYPEGSDTPVELVRHHLQTDVFMGVGLWDRLELAVNVPVTVLVDGETSPLFESVDPTPGLGDVRLVSRLRMWGDNTGLAGALVVISSLPTGASEEFRGRGEAAVEPMVAVDYKFDSGGQLALNVGYLFGPSQSFADVETGNALLGGLGFSYPVNDRFGLVASVQGQVPLAGTAAPTAYNSPLEGLLSVRWTPGRNQVIDVAAGPGLGEGVSAASVRAVAGYAYYSGDPAPQAVSQNEVEQPEEPSEPRCPSPEEALNGAKIPEGCPQPDRDGDGLADADDQCAELAEDMDGYQDEDGCPDEDDDADGIADADDQCPDEREVYNGFNDEDGCADEGDVKVFVTRTHIKVDEKIFFDHAKATIRQGSHSVLRQLAGTLRANAQIEKLEINGHADITGTDEFNRKLSDQRARQVRKFLINHGVDSDRLVAEGFGDNAPIASNESESGRAKNRRVEFVIIKQSK
jgi:outer membrane protein OmpA-like peptidoglycan-associated protein